MSSPSTHPTPVIEATDLGVTIGGQPILAGIDLTVAQGEVLALLGANGSGKSTLVRSLLGVIPMTTGAVRLFGAPLGPTAPWNRIGYVPQRLPAASGIPATALEVVTSGLLHGRMLRRPHGHRQRALDALADVGLADRVHQQVQEMSGGQQQRVLIARALVCRPDLLVLDEPTSGIDIPTQTTFVETISRLHEAGTTVVVILHELGPFAPLIDRAVVLRHGRVAHDGSPPHARDEHAGEWHDHTHAHSDPEEPPSPFTVEVLP
ncbi:metal ABC transporter ATP-binding protein [Cellulomonas sp. URHE0023]|uniref:metal ABC transporter ATP-binding protein n=1 Tax=Cellulomonas sp. URHE0023 TaxID=1380354 RepID=UPI00048765F0|nr:metal ABC transporter ATP-binding protein [Cellulomonas sp. URHE0023]